MEAVTSIEAETPEQALKLAHAQFNADAKLLLVPGSEDEGAAFDWVAEALPA